MNTTPIVHPRRFGLRALSCVRALPAVFALAALAVPSRSLAQTPTFNALVTTPVGVGSGFPENATVGDINGDGKLDAIIPGVNGLRVLLGNNSGTFVDRVLGMADVTISNVVNLHPSLVSHVTAAPKPVGGTGDLKAVDVNRDGKLDLVCVTTVGINFTNYSFTSVLLNTGVNNADGAPVFTTTHHWIPFLGVRPVTVGDLNGDNWPDFIVGTCCNAMQVWTSNGGNGTFTPGQAFSVTPNTGGPSIGQGVITDLNGDGKADYVVTSNQNGGANVFFGNGNGTLQTPGTFLPNHAVSVVVTDVNGDGRPDLLMNNLTGGSEGLLVYLNNGGGAFGAPTLFPITGISGGGSVAVADLNGDGKLDAALSVSYHGFNNVFFNQVVVLLGDGTGVFGQRVDFQANTVPTYLFASDFTGDGKPDIGVVLRNTRSFGVLTNTTVFAPAAQAFFTDSLAGPTSPNLATIPAGKYGYTGAGLARTQSNNDTDRPMVKTALSSYLTASNFTAEVTVKLANSDLLFFGLGQGDMDSAYFNEPSHAFYFRVHSNWGGVSAVGTGVRSISPAGFLTGHNLGGYAPGSTITLRIVRAGDNVTMSFVGGGSATYSLAAYPSLGLTNSNTRVFFGNTSVGSVFSNLKIYENPTDTIAPVIVSPGNVTREATSAAGAVVNFTATATDDVDGPVAVVAVPASGSTFAIGTTSVGLAASDAAGNTATAEFDITVRDTTAPVVSVPGNITAEATSASGASVTYSAPTATDAVGVTSLTSAPASGSTFALGNTTVTATARDAAGNTGTGSFTVSVVDTTAPALTVPASQTLEATSAAGAAASFAASATDAVGVTSLTYSAASGSTFALGTTTVTVTAKDAAGNTSTGSFTITVRDTTAPTITSLSTNAPTLWPPNHKMVAVTVSATAADLVGVTSLKIISATSNEPDNGLGDGDTAGDIQITGNLTLNLRAERSGGGNGRIYTITVEARDLAGNASTKTVTVTVPKSQGK